MKLTRHSTSEGPRWALDGRWLPAAFTLSSWLATPAPMEALAALPAGDPASGPLLTPVENDQEVWASGVTYLSSRLAREAESQVADVYQLVYHAARPELFFKAAGWRTMGPGEPIRIRADSSWNVPEPELTLVIHSDGTILGHTVGNDVSSRSIEGENPLYLPQAKVYNGSCAVGPAIHLLPVAEMTDLPIQLTILRDGAGIFEGETRTSQIKRPLTELSEYLFRELHFPNGAFLMTGTGIVPAEPFTLQSNDIVRIEIGGILLENRVA